MGGKNNILLIGKSRIMIKTFSNYFINKKIINLSFRESWSKPETIKDYESIVISGFHFEVCKMTLKELDKYILEYANYLIGISKKTKKTYLICTDLKIKHSFSRIVYFYYYLYKNIQNIDNIKILSFKTIYGIEKNFLQKLKIYFLKLFGIKIIHYKDLIQNMENFFLKNQNNINFYLIDLKRSRNFDRLIRLF